LRNPDVAAMVQDAIRYFDGERYKLFAWTIMPNHVHVLIEQVAGYPLGDIIHAWKSFTAKQANKQLGRTGIF
jgi:putative DNA methylase